ncbi:hypothetical protein O9G_006134, partial [Rozella allomycis CSF55]
SNKSKNETIDIEVLKEIEAIKSGIETLKEFLWYLGYIIKVLINVIDDWIYFVDVERGAWAMDVMASMKFMLQNIFTSIQL